MLYDSLVLQHGRLPWTGTPELSWRPDDHDESYLAHAKVPAEVLARAEREISGRTVRSHSGDEECLGVADEVEALAWSMPSDGRESERLEKLSDEELGPEIFRIGRILHVVHLKDSECTWGLWAAESSVEVTYEEAQKAELSEPEAARAGGPFAFPGRSWQSQWEAFRTARGREAGKLLATLPERVEALEGHMERWTFSSPAFRDVTFTTYECSVEPEQMGRYREVDRPWFELTDGLVWMRFAGGERALGPSEAAYDGGALPHFVGGVAVGGRRFLFALQNDRRVTVEVGSQAAQVVPEFSFGPSLAALGQE